MDFGNSKRPTQPTHFALPEKQNGIFIFDLAVVHERYFRNVKENIRLLFCLMQFVQYLCLKHGSGVSDR